MADNIKPKNHYFGWSKHAVVASVITLFVILAISTTSYFVGKNQPGANSPIPVIDLSQNNKQLILGSQMYNWNGTIVEIAKNDSEIVFSTQYRDDNGKLLTKQITAIVDGNTALVRWDVIRPSNDKPNESRTLVTFDELEAGQRIAVQTEHNIEKTDTVKAVQINVLISQ